MFFVFIFNTSKSGHSWKFISPKCLSFLNIVRRNWIFGSGGWTKHNISFESPRRVYYLEKYDDLRNFWTSRFLQIRMDHMNMKFEYFQIQNWMLKTVRTEKVDQKMESFVWFPCSLPELWSWNCLKKWVFCNLMLNSARNLSPLKQFTYMHPKGLATQKMVLFIMLWRTVSEVLKVWTNFVKLLLSQHTFWYFNCQYFINSGSDPYKPYHFLKKCNENFQMHIY